MRAITEGHVYELDNHESQSVQILRFVQKQNIGGIFLKVMEGTTNEEVLAALIDRIEYLNNKIADTHNVRALNYLKAALDELNLRTKERKDRGVEGTDKA